MKHLEDEAALQGLLTPAFKDWRVIVGVGISRWAGALVEAKLTHDDPSARTRRDGGSFAGERRIVTVHAKVRRPGGAARGIVEAVTAGYPEWRPSAQRLAFSRIEEGQRVDLFRAGCFEGNEVRGAVVKPMVHKFSDSAAGYKPPDMVALWGVWPGYALGWAPGKGSGVARAYLVRADRLESLLVKGRGSLGEAEAWELCDAVIVWP